jgi:hypothetical protein
MKSKNTTKRIGAVIAAFIISTCSCLTVTASAENDSRNVYDDQKTFVYVEDTTRSSDFVRNITYYANSAYYRCKATFRNAYSGTMYVTLKKQTSSGSWYTYDSCSDTFSNTNFCIVGENTNLTSGTYKIYVDIYTDTSSYSSNGHEIIIL